jgi:hypothetical protein
MPAPQRRRRSTPPTPDALAGLDDRPSPAPDQPGGGGLTKAAVQDPVLRTEPPAEPATQRRTRAPRAAGPSGVANAAGRAKVGFYQDADDTARARAAFTQTRTQEQHRSFSDFVAAALMAEVERLERTYNGGKPWPGMEAGEIPTGKPFGG